MDFEEIAIYDKDIARNVILRVLYKKGLEEIPDHAINKIVDAVNLITEKGDYDGALRILHDTFLRLDVPDPLDTAGVCIAKIQRIFNTVEEESDAMIQKIVRRVIEEMKRGD